MPPRSELPRDSSIHHKILSPKRPQHLQDPLLPGSVPWLSMPRLGRVHPCVPTSLALPAPCVPTSLCPPASPCSLHAGCKGALLTAAQLSSPFLLLQSCLCPALGLAFTITDVFGVPAVVPLNSHPALKFSTWHLDKMLYILGRIGSGSSFPAF